jgi:CheY-like chemotaxis protein
LPNLEGRNVLVVDDEEDGLQFVGMLVEEAGARARLAKSGQAALDILAREDVDILVSDIEMPEMDGHELIRRIRATKSRHLPAIAVSAHVRADETAAALAAGYDLHVGKPVDVSQLVTAIDTLLSLRST